MITIGSIEAATLLTKTAIENHMIDFDNSIARTDYAEAEKQNAHNAKQIADFYKTIFDAINK